MKKILLAFVFGMITLSVFPQKKVSFLDNEPWEKVLKQAQKAQKMVFVDCYTSWCVPCKHLMNVIFPQKIVSDYLDSMFVCVKYDIEKENGKAFEDQYPNKILAVPTMFVTDSHGNLLHVLRGHSGYAAKRVPLYNTLATAWCHEERPADPHVRCRPLHGYIS